MPRPKKSDAERLSKRIYCRFAPDEYDYLRRAAYAAGLSISDLVRRRLFGLRIPDHTEQKTLEELRIIRNLLLKHGGLFKHLYTTNPTYSQETAAALNEQIKRYGSIERLIQYAEKKVYAKDRSNDTAR